MRTIAEIKESMTQAFMQNEEAAKLWGFTVGDKWSTVMGRMSVENVLFYIVAVCCYVVEMLMTTHKSEVEAMVATRMPHTAKWYRDKTLAYLYGKDLIDGTDEYDTEGMGAETIEKLKVVKHAVAVEDMKSGVLVIKVAGEDGDGKRKPLTPDQCEHLKTYLGEVKDAGVRIEVINAEPSGFALEADVYYNALLDSDEVKEECKNVIKSYIENLEFNGILSRNGIEDVLRGVAGVEIVQLGGIEVHNSVVSDVFLSPGSNGNAYCRPYAGYCSLDDDRIKLNMKIYG